MARDIVSNQRKEKICPEEMEPDRAGKVPPDADAALAAAARAKEAADAAPEDEGWVKAAAASAAARDAAKAGAAAGKTPIRRPPRRKRTAPGSRTRRKAISGIFRPSSGSGELRSPLDSGKAPIRRKKTETLRKETDMPGFDQTGPGGMGPMTGGGRGWCGRSANKGGYGTGVGRGRRGGGRGFGGGARFGWGGPYAAPSVAVAERLPADRENPLGELRAEAEWTRNRLAEIEQRIATLETQDVE
jgi:hypothetical protein